VAAADTAPLLEALAALRATVQAARPRLPAVADHEREARRRRLVWHLDEYLLPRVRDLEAPLVAVLLGSTGAGKSSLLNGLVGHRVSPSGVIRPTTRRPVVLVAPADADAFLAGRVLGAMARDDRLELVVDPSGFAGVAVVDAPDLDSVETANRETADELLQAADLVVFVTTGQRYADAVPWDFLQRAHDRGVPLAVVVNRLPREERDRRAILDDCRRRFTAGLGAAGPAGQLPIPGHDSSFTLLPVLENEREEATDGLRREAVAPLRAALATLAEAGPARSAVKLQALRGALEGLPGAVVAVARDLDADQRRAGALGAAVRRAYHAELDALQVRLASGLFLRGEVMRAWQDFVGAGDVARWLATGLGRLRAWFVHRTRGPGATPQLEQAKEQAFQELTAALVRHADAAAGAAAEEWAADPASAPLIAEHPELWGHGAELPERAGAELTAWLGRLTRTVQERGRGRRAAAFTASLGVNALGVATMLAVFAQTAGLTGGEIAIATGTAVVNQKLLEALFGEAAVRSLIVEAESDLRATLERLLDGDAARFLRLVAPVQVTSEDLRAATERVLEEAGRLASAGGLGGRPEAAPERQAALGWPARRPGEPAPAQSETPLALDARALSRPPRESNGPAGGALQRPPEAGVDGG
jgi:Dynamin family